MAETDELTETGEQAELGAELEQEVEERPKELDPETRARRDAALRHVRKLGDPVLRASALAVDRFDQTLRDEIERMGELMGEALGIGLAATQIGVLHRVLVYRADPEDPLTVLVNPVLEWSSVQTETASEGCLSIPFVHVDVERPAEVRVRARDGYGTEICGKVIPDDPAGDDAERDADDDAHQGNRRGLPEHGSADLHVHEAKGLEQSHLLAAPDDADHE